MELKTIINEAYIQDLIDDQIRLISIWNTDTTFTNNLKSYLSTKLMLSLKPYLNLEALYNEDLTKEVFNMVFNNHFMDFYKSGVLDTLFFNRNLVDFDNIGAVSSESTNIQNYEGYDVANQDGQFIKNTASAKNTGNNRIQYMVLLETKSRQWIYEFIQDMVIKVCRIMY